MGKYKVNYLKLFILLFTVCIFIALFWSVLALSGCSVKFHEKQFIKKGGTFECDTTYVDVPVIVKGKDGKDSLIYVNTPCNCPDLETPPTNKELRRLDKKERDSLKRIERLLNDRNEFILDSLEKINRIKKTEGKTDVKLSKENTKKAKSNNKTKTKIAKGKLFKWYHWFVIVISFGLGLYLRGLLGTLLNNIKSKFNGTV